MPLTSYTEKLLLDWALGGTGGAVSSPANRFIQFASSVPDAANAYDGPFTNRMTVTFAAAASPAGSASNANALVRTATAITTVCGWNLYDQITLGNRLAYGTTVVGGTATGLASGDAFRFTAGSLVITIA